MGPLAEAHSLSTKVLSRLLNEIVDQLRRGVVHLHVEVFDPSRQVVVEPDGWNRDDQTERGLDERVRDPDRDGADTAGAAGRNAIEGFDNSNNGPEQSDEWGGR